MQGRRRGHPSLRRIPLRPAAQGGDPQPCRPDGNAPWRRAALARLDRLPHRRAAAVLAVPRRDALGGERRSSVRQDLRRTTCAAGLHSAVRGPQDHPRGPCALGTRQSVGAGRPRACADPAQHAQWWFGAAPRHLACVSARHRRRGVRSLAQRRPQQRPVRHLHGSPRRRDAAPPARGILSAIRGTGDGRHARRRRALPQ